MPKRSIREAILSQRRHLSAEVCFARSLKVQQRVLQTPIYQQAETLALYSPVRNEVFTEEIFQSALDHRKRIAYPLVRGNEIDFIEVVRREDLQPGTFGVLEPCSGATIGVRDLDLLVVPGVAFDLAGHRLGYGKGFYDRALHLIAGQGRLIGLCFEMQIVNELPAQSHDVRMDLIVTENRIIRQSLQP